MKTSVVWYLKTRKMGAWIPQNRVFDTAVLQKQINMLSLTLLCDISTKLKFQLTN